MGNTKSASAKVDPRFIECIDGTDYIWPTGDEPPFPFQQLPMDLQLAVASQLDGRTFIRLSQTCEDMKDLTKKIKGPIPHDLDSFCISKRKVTVCTYWGPLNQKYPGRVPYWITAEPPFQPTANYVEVTTPLTTRKCERLALTFARGNSKGDCMYIRDAIVARPEAFEKLLMSLKPDLLDSKQYFPPEYFDLNYVQNIRALQLRSCRISNEHLLSLRNNFVDIQCDSITDVGINKFLKQIKSGVHSFERFVLKLDATAGPRNKKIMLSGLDANVIWSPEEHKNSLVASFPLQHLRENCSIYSLFSHQDISKISLVYIGNRSIMITVASSEYKAFHNFFDDHDLFFTHFDRCNWCDTQICSHHSVRSVARIQKDFPKIWRFFVYSITGLRHLVSVWSANRVNFL